jgi:PAS domain S-box-containing protein
MTRLAPADPRWLGLAAGLAIVATLAAADALLDAPGQIVIASVVVAPFVAALVAPPRETLLVGAAAFATAVASAAWNGNAGETDYWVRLGIIAAGTALAVRSARVREVSTELRSVEAQMTAAVGNLAEAVTVQDADGTLVYANEAAARAFGFRSSHELLATPPAQIVDRFESFTDDGAPLAVERLPGRRVLSGERDPEPLTVRAIDRVTGEERWRQIKASSVLDPSGRVQLAVNIVEDITEVKRAELTQRLLAQAGEVLASSLDYERTLQQVAELAVPELADWCGVSMPEANGLIRQVAVAHVDPAKVEFARSFSARYPVRSSDPTGAPAVIREGRSEMIAEIPDELLEQAGLDPEQLELIRSLGMRSVIIAPMVAGGRTIGAISFVTSDSARIFTNADLELAEELGRRAGTAVENSRLYTERSHIARTLQASLLPDELPEIPGFSLATLYRPAGEENWVGGDFYDTFEVPAGWLVVVGDVAGRGADAAALTALARFTLRTGATLLDTPLAALAHLNAELLARSGMALVSVACALVTERDGEASVTVMCAGHPPPILVHDGVAEPIGRLGPLLGAFEDAHWDPVSVTLTGGEVLTLFTDGVLDTHGADERFGEERLRATLAAAGGSPREAVDAIEAALSGFEVGEQADDTAVVALMRSHVAASAGRSGQGHAELSDHGG